MLGQRTTAHQHGSKAVGVEIFFLLQTQNKCFRTGKYSVTADVLACAWHSIPGAEKQTNCFL